MRDSFVPRAGIVLVLTASVFAQEPRPTAPVATAAASADLAGLRERWLAAMKELGVPGMTVVAVRDGQVILSESLGFRDAEGQQPVTPDTTFYIASCTKTFTSFGILKLVEEGKIKLDVPVKTFLPRFELSDPELTKTITIRDLLTHSKGISGGPIVWLDAYTGQITEDRFYHHLKSVSISNNTDYSNVHFTLLGRVIEAVSGEKWQDYLDAHVFEPAGMKTATAYASEMYGGNAAIPCSRVDGKIVPARTRKTDRTMHAAGGMGASGNDLIRWLLLHTGGGEIDGKRLLSSALMKDMITPQSKLQKPDSMFPNQERTGFGYAWTLGTYRGERIVEHGGGYIGSSAWVTFMPDRKIGVAAVGNSGSRLPFMAVIDVYDRLLGGEPTELLPRLRDMTKRWETRTQEQLKKMGPNPGKAPDGLSLPIEAYAGKYAHKDLGTIQFATTNGELTAVCGDMPVMVTSTGKDKIELWPEDDSPSPGRFFVEDGKVSAFRVKLFEDRDEVVFRRE